MIDPATITIAEKLAWMTRELQQAESAYRRRRANGSMTTIECDHGLACMKAVVIDYRQAAAAAGEGDLLAVLSPIADRPVSLSESVIRALDRATETLADEAADAHRHADLLDKRLANLRRLAADVKQQDAPHDRTA